MSIYAMNKYMNRMQRTPNQPQSNVNVRMSDSVVHLIYDLASNYRKLL